MMHRSSIDRRLLFWLVTVLISSAALVGVVSAQDIVVTTAPTPNAATMTSAAPADAAAAATIVDAASDAAQTISGTAEGLWAQLAQTPQSDLARVLLILGGVVLLLAGWVVYEWIILIAGFLIGATTALALFPQANTLVALVVFLIGGVIGIALGALLYYVAVFLIGAYLGIVIAQGIAAALSVPPLSTIGVLVAAVVGGILLVLLAQELLVILSALVGAQMIALALTLGVGWMLLLALVGIIIQFGAARTRGVDFRRRPLRRTVWVRRRAI
ncbi:MAG: hypothetical protein GC204_09990 [Chloroflexi bacterium]|nr:hypothetical protein [Chloroflexota bacterium]